MAAVIRFGLIGGRGAGQRHDLGALVAECARRGAEIGNYRHGGEAAVAPAGGIERPAAVRAVGTEHREPASEPVDIPLR